VKLLPETTTVCAGLPAGIVLIERPEMVGAFAMVIAKGRELTPSTLFTLMEKVVPAATRYEAGRVAEH
jgi:hypothetical protein